jgi:hypothetical protein
VLHTLLKRSKGFEWLHLGLLRRRHHRPVWLA